MSSLKKSSIIDYVRPTLCSQLWNPDGSLKQNIRTALIETLRKSFEDRGFRSPFHWITGLYLSGSSTGYNYKEDGDVDLDITYSPERLKQTDPILNKMPDKELFEILDKIKDKYNGTKIETTTRTYSYMLLKPGDVPQADGIYDVLKNIWIKKPKPIPIDFDPDAAFVKQRQIAETVAQEIDLIIHAIVRTIDDLSRVDQYNNIYGRLSKKRVVLIYWLKGLCELLDEWYNWIWGLQKVALENGGKYPAFDFSPNWKEEMIIFKYLARYGYHQCVSNLYALLKDNPYLKMIDNFITD